MARDGDLRGDFGGFELVTEKRFNTEGTENTENTEDQDFTALLERQKVFEELFAGFG